MKQILLILTVALMAACSGQAPKEEAEKKAPITTAKDVAEQKLATAQQQKDSLTIEVQRVSSEETELATWVLENATKLNDQSPEVLKLNGLRMHLDSLKRQLQLTDGQIRFLERELKITHETDSL